MADHDQERLGMATLPRKPPVVPEDEKRAVIAACERFVEEVPKPGFLPAIVPSEWNYPVDIFGQWHGGRYRFIQRFRNDRPEALAPGFDAPFARVEWVAPGLYDVAYFRHTGQWWTIFRSVSLGEALRLIETETLLHPV
jgi:hypothetical protein